MTQLAMYRCPSSPNPPTNANYGSYSTANYVANLAVMEEEPNSANIRDCRGIEAILDGTSNTFMVSERGVFESPFRSIGAIWGGRQYSSSAYGFLSTRPINSPYTGSFSGTAFNDASYSRFAVTSLHPGGANFLLCDGSVRFISETIETNPNLTSGNFTYATCNSGNFLYQNLFNIADNNPIGQF